MASFEKGARVVVHVGSVERALGTVLDHMTWSDDVSVKLDCDPDKSVWVPSRAVTACPTVVEEIAFLAEETVDS